MKALTNFGYPLAGDNVRRKAGQLYDNGTFATATTEYNLFINPAVSIYNRNRNFPLSGMEVFFINQIQVWLGLTTALTYSAELIQAMRESFIQIIVDEREKIKIPLLECANFSYGDYIGATTFESLSQKVFNRARLLQIPIVINANSNVQVKLVTQSTTSTAFNAATFKVYLNGIKYDKLYDFEWDNWKGKPLEELSYSIYDVVTITANEETVECFSTRNKAITLFSKTLPLSDKENFQIEAIELFGYGTTTTSSLQAVLNEMRDMYLEITVDDTRFLESTALNMSSAAWAAAGSFQDADAAATAITQLVLHKGTYVLPVPIIIPANSKASVKLRHAALSHVAAGNFLVDFKGTLTRRVA